MNTMPSSKLPRVLLVEDSVVQQQVICTFLRSQGFLVAGATTLLEAQHHLTGHDLVVLDVILPDGNGFELLEHIRSHNFPLKVLMLSQLGEVHDRVNGLKGGADDYLGKPFDLTELAARLTALWRQMEPSPMKQVGRWRVRVDTHQVQMEDRTVQLTRQELQLLLRLAETPDQPIGRDALLREVWGKVGQVGVRIVDVHVHALRQKLGEHTIESVRGMGYRLAPQVLQK